MEDNIITYQGKVSRKLTKWYAEFIKSGEFKQLSKEQKTYSKEIITTFAEMIEMYEMQTPDEWDEHGVKCCSFWAVEIKLITDVKVMMAIVPVLTSFFEFLYRMEYKGDGIQLAEAVREVEPNRIRELRESRAEYAG